MHELKDEKSTNFDIENNLSNNDLSKDVKTLPEKKEVMPVISGNQDKLDDKVDIEPPKKRRKLVKNIFNKFSHLD